MSVRDVLGASLIAITASFSAPAHALNIVIGNDDGCEASAVHALYQRLSAAGHQVIVSAPMLDQSGQGGALAFLRPVTPLAAPSRGGNLPKGTPGVATLAGVPDLAYGSRVFCVNSTPVAAVLHGLDVAAAAVFGAPADLVISGVNRRASLGRGLGQRAGTDPAAGSGRQRPDADHAACHGLGRRHPRQLWLDAGHHRTCHAHPHRHHAQALSFHPHPGPPGRDAV